MNDPVILFRETYDVKTPTSLVIGDPLYLEQIEDTSTDFDTLKRLKSIVLIKDKIPAIRKAKLIFSKLSVEGYVLYTATLIITNKEHMEVFANDEYFPDKLKAQYDLGCDTAEYEIHVGYGEKYNSETIHTGADGYYGNVLESSGSYGFLVSFDMSSDLMTEKEMRQTLSYLFNCKNIKEENKND